MSLHSLGSPRAEADRRRAFGLEIEGEFYAPALVPAAGLPLRGPTRVLVTDAATVDAGWASEEAQLLSSEEVDGDSEGPTISQHPRLGYRLAAKHFGLARVSYSGQEIVCAPDGSPDWRWQRFLIGRVLPHAAVLQGLELLHASAVLVGGGVVGLLGPAGIGKTSLAIQMVLRGAGFVSDDVLALEIRDGAAVAYSGAATTSISPAEHGLLSPAELTRLGAPLGLSAENDLMIQPEPGPMALRSLYVLRRVAGGLEPVVHELGSSSLEVLSGNTYVQDVRSTARLRTQSEVAAAIATRVPIRVLSIRPGVTARELAHTVFEHESRR